MPYTGFRNGLDIQTDSAVDKRIYLTKAEMMTAEDDYMLPDKYFCICKDDGKMYLYDINNTPENGIGKYRLLNDTIDYQTPEAAENLDDAVAAKVLTTGAQTRAALDEVIAQTNLDGGEVE